ncbi:hypothetical protein ACPEIF_33435 [Streptomyces sp. NPDC012600]|uniref:hypothetical protein n=1 Tax=Streptomyces sp. NPDC012600 TaxID=3415005 RepID=UPI003C304B8C
MHLALPQRTPSWPYEHGVVRAREVLRDDERPRPPRLLTHGPRGFPDSPLPRPVGAPSVEAELDTIRTAPADTVRAGVRERYAGTQDHPFVRPYGDGPEGACAMLAEAYVAYWKARWGGALGRRAGAALARRAPARRPPHRRRARRPAGPRPEHGFAAPLGARRPPESPSAAACLSRRPAVSSQPPAV